MVVFSLAIAMSLVAAAASLLRGRKAAPAAPAPEDGTAAAPDGDAAVSRRTA